MNIHPFQSADAQDAQIDILFIPVSGPMGMGELAQCAILAQALKLAIPEITMACLLHHMAAAKFAPGWREIPLEQTPTLANRETTAWIKRLQPRVVLFDSAGRAAQLKAAKAAGAYTIFLAGRETSRRKIISLRRLRYLDALWLSQPAAFWRPLPLWKRLLLRCYPKLHVAAIGVVFAKADTRQLEPELAQFANKAPYVLMTLGGGGIFSAGIAQNDLAFQAAQACFTQTGVRSILICGPNATELPASSAACYVLRSIPNAALVALIEASVLVLCNGGYTLLQAVALNKATLALALQGDQQQRIDRLAAIGATCATRAESLIADLLQLVQTPAAREALASAARTSGVDNGLDHAVRYLCERVRR